MIEADPVLGFHGPASMMWRVNREAVLLGAGPTALLLQIAHPLVAEAVAAHSDFRSDPLGRLRRTLDTTLRIVFGDGATAGRAVDRLNRIHSAIEGDTLDPASTVATGASDYRALDPELLQWVQATLLVTSVRAYEAWVAPLTEADREAFWTEARAVGERLGIPAAVSPATWTELVDWFEACLGPAGPITVTPTARSLSGAILRPPLPLIPGPLLDVAMLPGLDLLPPRLRREFGIPASTPRHLLTAAMTRGIRAWVRVLPANVRAMPQARAADRRCQRSRRSGSSATIAPATP